jgi:hypothetical protein
LSISGLGMYFSNLVSSEIIRIRGSSSSTIEILPPDID